jgi:5'-deoxynucleotidase YfbR-like HD superfamily hydrolase
LTTDIPTPAWRFLPSGAKTSAERQAMAQIAGETPTGGRLLAWWEELLANETAEAHLVHDADKLDQYLQAVVYEQQTGNRLLQEFWLVAHRFHTPQAQAVYDELRRRAAVSQ